MNKQPDALRLADELQAFPIAVADAAAAELRRLSDVERALEIQGKALRQLSVSEKEGWRYADELEQERKRLTALNEKLAEALENIRIESDEDRIVLIARAAIAAAKESHA